LIIQDITDHILENLKKENDEHGAYYILEGACDNVKTQLSRPFKRYTSDIAPDHLLLDSAPNLGPLISRWETKKFENC
jgi:hypothetical protein